MMELTSGVFLVSTTLLGLVLCGVVYIVNLIRSSKEEDVQKSKHNPPQKKEKKRQAEQITQKQPARKKQEKWTRDSKHTFSHPWLLTSLKGHNSEILDMDLSSNGKFLASCGDDGEPGEPDDASSSASSGIAACDGVTASDTASDVGSSNDAASDSGCSVGDTNKENVEPGERRGRGPGTNGNGGAAAAAGRRNRNNGATPNNAATQGGRQRSRRQKKNAAPAKKAKGRAKQTAAATAADNNRRQGKEDKQLIADIPTQYTLSLRSKVKWDDLELWQFIKRYALEKEKLYDLSYPVESPAHPGHARVFIAPSRRSTNPAVQARNSVPYRRPDDDQMSHLSERRCARCFRKFFLSKKAKLKEHSVGIFEYYWSEDPACFYHWGKLKLEENNYMYQYSCCNGRPGFHGCSAARFHVWVGVDEGDNGPLIGYVQTQPRKKPPLDGNYGVYALDCEMCYTAHGLEVAKVTVVALDGRLVYDTFIKPGNEIVDYNTRFSGITPEDLNRKGATKTLKRVQRDLLSFISAETILIGHGLENDLRGLKIIHSTIVDTALLFPHKRGFPFRYSLKSLVNTILNRDIQGDASGHNSYEDACACIELILWKMRRDTRPLAEITS